MPDAVIYYNPRCATCRKTLELLQKKKIQPRIVDYLKTPPSERELEEILGKLNIPPEGLARKKEPLYAEKAEGRALSRSAWVKLLHEHPVLIERPIVVIGNRAVIARPPEKVHEII